MSDTPMNGTTTEMTKAELRRLMKQCLTVTEVASMLQCGEASVSRAYHNGTLKGIRVSPRVLRFSPTEVARYLNQGNPSAGAAPQPTLPLENVSAGVIDFKLNDLHKRLKALEDVVRMRSLQATVPV